MTSVRRADSVASKLVPSSSVAGGQKAQKNGGEPRFAIPRVRCEGAAEVRTVRLATRGADGDVAEVAILEAHGVESALLVGRTRTSAAFDGSTLERLLRRGGAGRHERRGAAWPR
jgi:hypothetical protein